MLREKEPDSDSIMGEEGSADTETENNETMRSTETRANEETTGIDDPIEAARSIGLRYVGDDVPGITRESSGKGFRYRDPDRKIIRDKATLSRVASLAIPPAWTDVWISPSARGHIQATGRDAKGRKQYRYHPRYRETRNISKYDRMLLFADALPRLRERVDADLVLPGMPREKVLAAVVRLLELTMIRVGNESYARENGSFGLTTLRNRHARIDGSTVRFRFRGKSGVRHEIELHDRRLARIVGRCRDLPGHELFEYIDAEGTVRRICSDDVNTYLREICGEEFTAKDFRTWGGTVHAASTLAGMEEFGSETEAKRRMAEAVKQVAAHLGNRPATCRSYYIHPAVMNAYLSRRLQEIYAADREEAGEEHPFSLTRDERVVVELLRNDR